jgi:hypothetical protein
LRYPTSSDGEKGHDETVRRIFRHGEALPFICFACGAPQERNVIRYEQRGKPLVFRAPARP